MLFIVFPLLELFFSRWIVVAVAKENLLNTPGFVSLANFKCIQMLPHPRLALDWLSLSFFDYWPISGLLLLCTELPENCIYLNQSELSNFFMYIIKDQTNYARMSVRNWPLMKKSPHPPAPPSHPTSCWLISTPCYSLVTRQGGYPYLNVSKTSRGILNHNLEPFTNAHVTYPACFTRYTSRFDYIERTQWLSLLLKVSNSYPTTGVSTDFSF